MDADSRILLSFIQRGSLLLEQFLTEQAQRWQISPSEARILLFLHLVEGKDAARDVAQFCGMSKASVSGNVLKLATRGLLTVEVDLKDRRFQRLKLTEQAVPILETIDARMRTFSDELLPGLDENARATLLTVLSQADGAEKN